MFANISGFSAWASVRDPVEVFNFLDTIFSDFDEISETHSIFKVETVKDCYGKHLPVPSLRHFFDL